MGNSKSRKQSCDEMFITVMMKVIDSEVLKLFFCDRIRRKRLAFLIKLISNSYGSLVFLSWDPKEVTGLNSPTFSLLCYKSYIFHC